MTKSKKNILALILTLGFLATSVQANETSLDQFSWLIGGKWKMGENTYHTFEWGFKKGSVIAKTYSNTEKGFVLVSKGLWFWHPEHKTDQGFLYGR